jgi:hypothetical protein
MVKLWYWFKMSDRSGEAPAAPHDRQTVDKEVMLGKRREGNLPVTVLDK